MRKQQILGGPIIDEPICIDPQPLVKVASSLVSQDDHSQKPQPLAQAIPGTQHDTTTAALSQQKNTAGKSLDVQLPIGWCSLAPLPMRNGGLRINTKGDQVNLAAHMATPWKTHG